MDKIIAARMEKELSGSDLGGWSLAERIGHGKSALVFRAKRGAEVGAVKVFDRELVERYGKTTQRERVNREKSLVGRHHPHLIRILDAGEDEARDLFYVVMDLFPGKNLAQVLEVVPAEAIHRIVSQVAAAAQFLDTLNLAHRDIKPENIGISDDFATAVLLDLGVLRPVGLSSITDQRQLTFVGTLQYSPPELLRREEVDSQEGWRAVSFYQLGAVLHDLLTRTPLFKEDLDPYARLVDAVSRKRVVMNVPNAPPELRMLAQDCLVKDPRQRLQLVSWQRFEVPPPPRGDLKSLKERIQHRKNQATAPDTGSSTVPPVRQAVEELREKMERVLRDACKTHELPPFVIQSDDSSTARLTLCFGPSRAHAVSAPFSLYITGVVLDAVEQIIRINAAAALAADRNALPSTPPNEAHALLFQGVRTDDILTERLTEVLLVVLDAVQDACGQGRVAEHSSWLPIPVKEKP